MAGFQKNAFEDEARKILREYNAAYQQAGELLIAAVIANIDRGMKPSEAVREALVSTDFEAQIQKALSDATYLAACAGYGILPFMVADAAGKVIRRKLSDSWARDNVKLSDRLHAIAVQEKVVQTIQVFLRKSEATRDLAKKLYDGYGFGGDLSQVELPKYLKELLNLARQATNNDPAIMRELRQKAGKANQAAKKLSTRNLQAAYYGLVDACGDKLKQTAIEKAARVAIEEKTRYYAERIARTETARAWFDGFLASTQDDKDVWGYRWVLSSRHKFACFDSCDLCAYGNVGYGAGIYPKNKVPPIPQHPHCMCSLVTVIVGETRGQDKEFDADGVTKYIDGLSDKESRQLFGVEGAKKYRAGGNWQKLARGWQGYGKPQGRLKDEDFKPKHPLPNFENAVIAEAKIFKYALNENHPKGCNKAIAFKKALGFTQDNGELLIEAIRKALPSLDCTTIEKAPYGVKYSGITKMEGVNGKIANVCIAMQIDTGTDFPRLTSVYVK